MVNKNIYSCHKGKIENDPINIIIFLTNDPRYAGKFRYNLFTNSREYNEETITDSTIRHITIKKYGNFFVLKQKDGFKTGLFKEAIYSCDFIVVSYDKVYFVELKSVSDNTKYNNDTNPLDKALEQCKSSQLLFDYLCSAYNLQKSVQLNCPNT